MPGSFRFEPCANCCVTGCVYESDDFNRADSSSLGAKWTETAGDWSIDTNRLKIAAGTNVARVFVNNSGQFAELERITATCGRLRLYDGATCKGSVGVSLGGYTRLVVCIEAAKIHVGTGGSPMLTIPATAISDVVALGTGDGSKCTCTTAHPTGSKKLIVSVSISFDGAGNIFFEDFSLSKHFDDDASCPSCGTEGCFWSYDWGHCASGSLPAVDYTTTGTWSYASNIRCSADGVLTILTSHPLASQKTIAQFAFAASWPGNGATITIGLGGAATIVLVPTSSLPANLQLWKAGIQYGPTLPFVGVLSICWDGTSLSCISDSSSTLIATTDTIPAISFTVSVSGLGSGKVLDFRYMLRKHTDDLSNCAFLPWPCGQSCTNCSVGTFSNHAQVVIANITSNDYGCTCTDQTIDLYAASSGCVWTGTKSGPCSSGTWTATATVSAVAGGYKLTVVVTTTSGATATFEDTVVSGSPVDCLTAFDGDIPLVSYSGTTHCTFNTATCTFTAP